MNFSAKASLRRLIHFETQRLVLGVFGRATYKSKENTWRDEENRAN